MLESAQRGLGHRNQSHPSLISRQAIGSVRIFDISRAKPLAFFGLLKPALPVNSQGRTISHHSHHAALRDDKTTNAPKRGHSHLLRTITVRNQHQVHHNGSEQHMAPRLPFNRGYIVKDGAIIPPAPAYRVKPLPPPARYLAENSGLPHTVFAVRTWSPPGNPSGLAVSQTTRNLRPPVAKRLRAKVSARASLPAEDLQPAAAPIVYFREPTTRTGADKLLP
nr:hypothetical protein Iba_chr03bCG0020 [Ipomoea batatas]GMC77599.1 hypothetical protein Iba_chr03fCG0030 [Ipomoea batatas]